MSIRNSCDKIAIEKQKNNNKTIKGRTFSFMSVKKEFKDKKETKKSNIMFGKGPVCQLKYGLHQ